MCDCSSLEYTHTQTLVFNIVYREKKEEGQVFPSLYSDFFKVRTAEKGKPLIVVRLPLHLLRGKIRKK